MPYSFEYSASDPEGSHSHSSTSDGKTVTGEYSINLADGRMRTVKYRADENGYRAEIMTNELGTESKNPADVTIESSALTAAEAALQAPAPTPVAAPNAVGIDSNAAEAVSRDASASHLDHIYVQPQFASDYQQQEFQRHYYDSRYTQ
ncbi:pupal cuticle protein Edg-84A-like [Tropilaelaps mercedesae]|uniref:Pupal cuticle protein Edg-84A-like n=1 Tax=Tropilaelaps mercedesae TaxID=418985 RepID=A0A1V9XZ82_9ACAR|nr:pupal cuticle protein Edg-84A-like [Tropilaelaps mercedesae]